MAKPKEKQKALELRKKGKSIKEIARIVGVSKGSVSLWCQDIELTVAQRESLKRRQIESGHRGRVIGAERNKQKRVQRIAHWRTGGKREIKKLSKRDMMLLGLGLYWGEGVKSRTGPASLVNSDPALVLFAKRWFEQCLGVKSSDFRPYIFISEQHKDRSSDIHTFWEQTLSLPREQFHDIIFLKGRPKKFYKNRDSYYGILALRIKKGTDLKYRIQGLIDACKTPG